MKSFSTSPPQIPAMAVEMPGSSDISGLHLQFGALQFGSEPVLQEYDSNPNTTAAPSHQVQNSLYAAPSRWGPPSGLSMTGSYEEYRVRCQTLHLNACYTFAGCLWLCILLGFCDTFFGVLLWKGAVIK